MSYTIDVGTYPDINNELLCEEIEAAIAPVTITLYTMRTAGALESAALSRHDGEEFTSAQEDAIAAVLAAHDHMQKTDKQEALEQMATIVAGARAQMEGTPDWAAWTTEEAEDWIDTNVTDLASAKVVVINMAKAVISMRNRLWPELEAGATEWV